MTTPKYEYLYVLQGYYQGWEDLTAAQKTREGLREVQADRKEYQKNEGGSYRIITRRVKNVPCVTLDWTLKKNDF